MNVIGSELENFILRFIFISFAVLALLIYPPFAEIRLNIKPVLKQTFIQIPFNK